MGPEGPERKSNATGGLSQVRESRNFRGRKSGLAHPEGVPKTLLAMVPGIVDQGSATLHRLTPIAIRPCPEGGLCSYRTVAEPADAEPLSVGVSPKPAATLALFSGMGLVTAEGLERPVLAERDRLRRGD